MQAIEGYRQSDSFKQTWMPWLVCFAASLFFFYEFIQGNMFASIADNIMSDFHVEADKMAMLSSIHYFSNVLFLFVAGMLLDRFPAKQTILVAMSICVLSTFILSNTHSFQVALLCRFMTGIGSAFCFLGPIRIASQWFPPKRMAMISGAIVTMAMTGGMVAQYPLTRLVEFMGWRDAVVMIGILGVGILIFMFYAIQDKKTQQVEKQVRHLPLAKALKEAYLNPQALRAAAYTSLMNMPVAVLGAMIGTLYIMQRIDVSKQEAAFVNSMLFLGAIIGGPLIGWCSDKLSLRVLPMKVGAICSLVIVLGILYLPVPMSMMAVLFFLLGLFTAAQVISYALVAESSSPLITATAVSLVSILTQGGYLVYQNVFSWVLSHQHSMHMLNGTPIYSLNAYQSASLMFPFGLLLALLVLFKLKETHCRQKQG